MAKFIYNPTDRVRALKWVTNYYKVGVGTLILIFNFYVEVLKLISCVLKYFITMKLDVEYIELLLVGL